MGETSIQIKPHAGSGVNFAMGGRKIFHSGTEGTEKKGEEGRVKNDWDRVSEARGGNFSEGDFEPCKPLIINEIEGSKS
jgi:hypothetical protein